jgi:hypothetical protein
MLLQSEVLDLFERAKTRQEKLAVLKQHETPVLRALMRINFDPSVSMDLPEDVPPFKRDPTVPIGYNHTNLVTEYKRFYIWLDKSLNINKVKKEQLFIEMLEGLHYSEAELLCFAKDKKLQKKYKSLKEDIVREAYPATLPPKETKAEG